MRHHNTILSDCIKTKATKSGILSDNVVVGVRKKARLECTKFSFPEAGVEGELPVHE